MFVQIMCSFYNQISKIQSYQIYLCSRNHRNIDRLQLRQVLQSSTYAASEFRCIHLKICKAAKFREAYRDRRIRIKNAFRYRNFHRRRTRCPYTKHSRLSHAMRFFGNCLSSHGSFTFESNFTFQTFKSSLFSPHSGR